MVSADAVVSAPEGALVSAPDAVPALPGWRPATSGSVRRLTDADLDQPWQHAYRQRTGVVPLGVCCVEDMVLGSQLAAKHLDMPGGGLSARLLGPHVYLGSAHKVVVGDWIGQGFSGRELDAWAIHFQEDWAGITRSVDGAFRAMDHLELDPPNDLSRAWQLARDLHRRVWTIHFDLMYRVLAVHQRFLRWCAGSKIGTAEAEALLGQPADALSRTTDQVRRWADVATEAGWAELMREGEPAELRGRLEEAGAEALLAEIDALTGQRDRAGTVGTLDAPGWREDDGIVFELIREQLAGTGEPDDPELTDATAGADPNSGAEAASGADPTPRAEATDDSPHRAHSDETGVPQDAAILSKLAAESERFAEVLRLAREVNAPWWHRDHLAVLDLRAHLPMRRVLLAAAQRLGADPGLVVHLYEPEFVALLSGQVDWSTLEREAAARVEPVAVWRARRHEVPNHFGPENDNADQILHQLLGHSESQSR